jgi:hypothetical protein
MTEISRFLRPPKSSFFLFGPRGTGKSTWLRRVFPDAPSIDLLEPDLDRELSARPERLGQYVAGAPHAREVIVDEVQRVPEFLTVVHQMIEEKRRLRFVLTGSSARKLRRTGVDLLGGRAVRCTMHPFMAAELGAEFDLDRALLEGLVPGVCRAAEPRRALQAYLALYVREEVKSEGLVRNLGAFSRFLEVISLSHASVVNLANVARECQVSRSTVEGYLEVFEDLLLAYRLPVFTRRAKPVLAASQALLVRRRRVSLGLPRRPPRSLERDRGRWDRRTGRPTPARLDRLRRQGRHSLLLADEIRQRGRLRRLRPERDVGRRGQEWGDGTARGPPRPARLPGGLPGSHAVAALPRGSTNGDRRGPLHSL